MLGAAGPRTAARLGVARKRTPLKAGPAGPRARSRTHPSFRWKVVTQTAVITDKWAFSLQDAGRVSPDWVIEFRNVQSKDGSGSRTGLLWSYLELFRVISCRSGQTDTLLRVCVGVFGVCVCVC